MYKIKLKEWDTIKGICYEADNNELGLDGIAYEEEALKEGKYDVGTLIGSMPYGEDGDRAYIIQNEEGKKRAVHLDWIGEFNKSKRLGKDKGTYDGKVVLTRKYQFNLTTCELIELKDLPLCTCGAVGTIAMYDGSKMCKSCSDDLTTNHDYSYRPTYKYIGKQIKADEATPTWYGLEVEVSTNREELAKFVYKHSDSVYLKSDSSINGSDYCTEIVSMPHSFTELMKKKDSWLDDISTLSTNEVDANGCHVHISRTAFKDDKHYGLFYFLLHSIEGIATKVGGRDLTNYCKMSPTGRVHNKGNKGSNDGARDIFLNERGEHTVEARFFKGTTDTAKLKGYVQLLESLIKYTRYHSKMVTIKGWFQYITKKSTKYKELLAVVGDVTQHSEYTNTVCYREPKKIRRQFSVLKAVDIANIVEVVTVSGSRFTNLHKIELKGDVLFYKRDGGVFSSSEIPIRTINYVIIEEA